MNGLWTGKSFYLLPSHLDVATILFYGTGLRMKSKNLLEVLSLCE